VRRREARKAGNQRRPAPEAGRTGPARGGYTAAPAPEAALYIAELLLACRHPAPPEPPPAAIAPVTVAVPPTRRDDVVDTLHGVAVPDPYRWLENEKAEDVQAWMKAQDEYTRLQLARLPGRDVLRKRFTELYYVDSVSPPALRGDRLFYMKTFADKEKAVLYWRQGDGEEKVLLDPNAWTGGNVSLGDWVPSWDGKRLAFMRNPNHADEAVLYVMDVDTLAESEVDVIEGAKYASPSWRPDGAGFYYEWLPTDPSIPVDARPGYTEIRYHALGADPKDDAVIRPATHDPTTFHESWLSRDGRWLFEAVYHGWNATDVWMADLSTGKTTFKPIMVGKPNLYLIEAWDNQLYIYTDEGAPRKRLFRASALKPDRAAWTEIVPEDPSATLDSYGIVGGKLVLAYMKDVRTDLRVAGLDGKGVHSLTLPDLGVASLPSGLQDRSRAFFQFSSYTRPPEVWELSMNDEKSSVWASVELPIDPSPYVTEQVWYPSKDGTRVPMFIVHRKDLAKNGQNPTLLYGYGGFDVSLQPEFRARMYPWLERGGVYAVANLRGGGEFGKAWHDAGKGHVKQNVFDDFIGAAEFLVKEGYTAPSRLAINGASNGGLLMGAAMTQRPDLFAAVVCGVPLLDMVRYHLFGSGRTWIPEYGTAENAEDFPSILAYSPYQRVKPAPYPALLMMSADHDDRVDPMHARKFVAAVQNASLNHADAWLRIEREAGHGGADQVSKAIDYSTDMWSFIMARTGVVP
jgi:prolyl oligopeptidase